MPQGYQDSMMAAEAEVPLTPLVLVLVLPLVKALELGQRVLVEAVEVEVAAPQLERKRAKLGLQR